MVLRWVWVWERVEKLKKEIYKKSRGFYLCFCFCYDIGTCLSVSLLSFNSALFFMNLSFNLATFTCIECMKCIRLRLRFFLLHVVFLHFFDKMSHVNIILICLKSKEKKNEKEGETLYSEKCQKITDRYQFWFYECV